MEYPKILKKIFYISLILMLLPPLGIGPLNINNVANILWILLLAIILIINFIQGKAPKINLNKLLIFFAGLFFSAQSLSVLPTHNIGAFLFLYKTVVLSMVFLILSAIFINKANLKMVMKTLLIAGIINLMIQGLIFFQPLLFLQIGRYIFQNQYLNTIINNMQRGRIYFESYDEILAPLIIFFVVNMKREKKKTTLILLALLALIGFFSFVSNFRTRFVMFFFALIPSIHLLLRKKSFLVISLLTLGLAASITYSNFNPAGYEGTTVIDRLLFQDKREDVLSITGRIAHWFKATEIGLSSPVFGVGLNNYYDYLNIKEQKSLSLFIGGRELFNSAAPYPHNIFFQTFAETGFLGLFSLMLLLVFFLKKDWLILQRFNILPKTFIISFWTLFFFSLFNPAVSTRYFVLFWLLRVMIEESPV